VYNYDNRPTSITQSGVTGFVYDYRGQRVKKTGSSTTIYISKLYEITGGVYTKYIFAGKKRIAKKTDSLVHYYHKDHLGSSNVITGGGGSAEEEIYYFPYGATRLDTGGPNVKHKFTGQELDSETGLYYYGARYYDPVLARFITPDSIVPDQGDPQSLNRYSYGRNNPIYYTDPEGHLFTPYHYINTFVSELIVNPPWAANKIAWRDLWVDALDIINRHVDFWKGSSNQHNMIGKDPGTGTYQKADQFKEAMNRLAWQYYEEGNRWGSHHLINDWVHGLWGQKLQSMQWYNAIPVNKALHFIIIDINPINWAIAFFLNVSLVLNPYGTTELTYGAKPVAQPSSQSGTGGDISSSTTDGASEISSSISSVPYQDYTSYSAPPEQTSSQYYNDSSYDYPSPGGSSGDDIPGGDSPGDDPSGDIPELY